MKTTFNTIQVQLQGEV